MTSEEALNVLDDATKDALVVFVNSWWERAYRHDLPAALSVVREELAAYQHLRSEFHFEQDRGDHVVYREEWERFDRWQRGEREQLIDERDAAAGERNGLREALISMVYVHPCNCGGGIPEGDCARCRAVLELGFDPCLPAPAQAEEERNG